MKEVKIAMVGTGFAANLHAENYKRLMGVDAKIVAVASKNWIKPKIRPRIWN